VQALIVAAGIAALFALAWTLRAGLARGAERPRERRMSATCRSPPPSARR
jgi:hypothetical protein